LGAGAPDFLLRLLVEKAQDKSTIWQHIVRITDPDVAAHMVLRHLQAWPLEVCLELLGMCRDRVSPSAPTAEEVERQYRQLSALRDVLQVRVVRVRLCRVVCVVRVAVLVNVRADRMMCVVCRVSCCQVEGASNRWRTWQDLAQACREQPSAVTVTLMELRQWKLARQLAQVRTHPLFSPLCAVVRVRFCVCGRACATLTQAFARSLPAGLWR